MEQAPTTVDGPNYSNLGGIVQLGLLAPPSQRKSKRAARSARRQAAWDPYSSVKIPAVWTPPGNGTRAENFRDILKQAPRAPGASKLVQAWLSYNDAIKIAERNVDGNDERSIAQSNGNPKMCFLLSALCKDEDLRSNIPDVRTLKARSASRFHDSNVEELEGRSNPSADCAHENRNGSPATANRGPSESSAPGRRVRQRNCDAINRYSRAAKRSDIFSMIQQHRAEDRKAGQELNDITTLALRRQKKKRERFRKYREGRLETQHPPHHDNRVSKKQNQKPPQQAKVNVKYTHLSKQKKALDGLFSKAGYE